MAYADRVLDALGDPTRRQIFKRLRSGARSVGQLADGMEVSRPAVSQHLRVLKDARLVTDRAEGTRMTVGHSPCRTGSDRYPGRGSGYGTENGSGN